MGFDHEDGIDFERFNAKYMRDPNLTDLSRVATYAILDKLSEHESVIGVYIYPYKRNEKRVAIELSSGRQIEGEAFVSLADAVKSAKDRLTEHFEADYETL